MMKFGTQTVDGEADRQKMLKQLAEGIPFDPAHPANTPAAMAEMLRGTLAGFGRTAGKVAELHGPDAGRQFIAEVRALMPSEDDLRAVLGEDAAAEMVRIIREAVE